jgi:hypothetical protein
MDGCTAAGGLLHRRKVDGCTAARWTAAPPLYPAEIPFLELEAIEAIGDQELEATTASALADAGRVLAAADGGGGVGGGSKETSISLSPNAVD